MAGNGLTRRLICVMLLVGMLSLSFVSTAQQASLPHAEAQGLELVERGRDFERYWNGSTEQHTMVIGVPTWVFDVSEGEGGYRSYTFRELGNNVVEVKTGLVSGVVHEDRMELYDPDLTELRAVERLDLHIGGKVALAFTSQVVSHDTNGIDITNHYNLDQDATTICTISITYSFQAGKPLSRLISDNNSCPKGLSKVLDTVWHMPTTIDEVDTAKSNATKSSESNDKLSAKPITKTNNNDIDNILMKKNNTMWIREATMPNKDVLDSIKMSNNSVRFSYDLGQDGIDFRHADTYTADNPTVDGFVTEDRNETCTSGDRINTSIGWMRASGITQYKGCERIFIQWDITSIPDDMFVTNVELGFDVRSAYSSARCDFMEMDTEPHSASAATIFNDIGDGTVFLNADSTCSMNGDNKLVDLGAAADADVEAQLSANWWAVGVKIDNEHSSSYSLSTWETEEATDANPTPTLTVTFRAANRPPIADAGPDQTVNEGRTVTLNGRGSSDPDDNTITYIWYQASGPSVTLSDNYVSNPTFTAPTVSTQTVIVFELFVGDGITYSSSDDVSITVNNTPTKVTQPIRLTLANTGSVIIYNVTTCSAVPSTVTGDGVTHNVSVSPSCSVRVTPTNSQGGTTRYTFDNDSVSRSFTSCSSGTCSSRSYNYWYQHNSAFNITTVYGPTQSLLSYTQAGTASSQLLSEGANFVWTDNGTPWTVRNPEVSGDERWVSQDVTSGTIPVTNDMTFVHQFNKGLAYSLPLGGTLPSVPSITLSQNRTSVNYALTSTITDRWTDATGYTTSTINNGNERFMPPGGGVITDATDLTIPYYLQYRFTIGFTIHAGGMPLNAADRIDVTYENAADTVTATFDSPGSQQIWADNSNTVTFPQLSTASNTVERHITPDVTTVTPSPGGSHTPLYFNQLALNFQTTGAPVPKPKIAFTGNATTTEADIEETRTTFWADRGSTYTIDKMITVSPTERYHTMDTPDTTTVTTSDTRIMSYRHDFLVGNLVTNSNHVTQNGKALRNKITTLKVTMANNTSFTNPVGWLGQVDGVGTNNVDWYTWNGMNKTNTSPFTIDSDTTIALKGLAADSDNNIQLGMEDGIIITSVIHDTTRSTFTWTGGIPNTRASGTYDLVVDIVNSTHQEAPTFLTINTRKHVDTSPRWNYDDNKHIFTFEDVQFEDTQFEKFNEFTLGFFSTDLTLWIYDEFDNINFLDGDYCAEVFGSQNITRTNLCTEGHKINATINGGIEYVRLTRSPLTDDSYWRELWTTNQFSGKVTLNFFMVNQTERNLKEYRLFLQTSTSKWTPDATIWNIRKQSELGEDINIERQRMDSELKTLMHLVTGETYKHELYHTVTGETLALGELKTDDTLILDKYFLPELGIVSQGEVWLVNHVRASDYTSLIVNISKITPSNINLHVYDLISTDTWYNHTGVTHIEQVIPIMANRTYYVTGYSTNSPESAVLTFFSPRQSIGIKALGGFSELGLVFGVPIANLFILSLASVALIRNTYIFFIILGAALGLLGLIGMLSIDNWAWGVITVIIAIGVMMGRKSS